MAASGSKRKFGVSAVGTVRKHGGIGPGLTPSGGLKGLLSGHAD